MNQNDIVVSAFSWRLTKRILPPHIQDEQMRTFKKRMPITFPQLFVAKAIGYGLVTLVTASVIRAL